MKGEGRMKNNWLNHFHSILKVKITGRNVNNFVRRIVKEKINIIKLIPISYKEVELIIPYEDYLKLKDKKTIYEITVIKKYGKLKMKDVFKRNSILLCFLILGLGLLYFLSNIIFSIDIIHSSSDIKKLLNEELTAYGLKKYTIKKSYHELEDIEEKILNNNKDKLEWIEIETSGTKYIVRAEERLLNDTKEESKHQDIVATKNAVITEINAEKGEKVKKINDYVKKGDIIIAGSVTLPDNTQTPITAIGKVYGEVWYTIDVEYPFVYREEKATGKVKTVYSINFLHHKLSLFNFQKFKTFNSDSKILLQSPYLPITFTKDKQYEVLVTDEVYTREESLNKAINLAEDKLKKQNDKIKKINKITILKQTEDENKIMVKLFISAIEEIGKTQEREIPVPQETP